MNKSLSYLKIVCDLLLVSFIAVISTARLAIPVVRALDAMEALHVRMEALHVRALTTLQGFADGLIAGDHHFDGLAVHSSAGVLPDGDAAIGTGLAEQVPDHLVVDLHEGCPKDEVSVGVRVDVGKDVLRGEI